DEEHGVPGRQEAHGCRRLGGRERRPCDVQELTARLVPEAAQGEPLESRCDVAWLHASPQGDVAARCWAERAEIATDELVERGSNLDVLRPDPALGGLEEMRTSLLPRTRRWDTDELDPRACQLPAPADHLNELVVPSRPVGQQRPQLLRPALEVGFLRARLLYAEPPIALWRADRNRERPVVASRHDVDRPSHERRLDDRSALEGAREVGAAEPHDARPQPDVGVRRVLILDSADPLEYTRDRQTGALEQELSGEQGAVQLTLREGSLGVRRHGANLAATDAPGRWASAMPPTTRAPPTASQIVTG